MSTLTREEVRLLQGILDDKIEFLLDEELEGADNSEELAGLRALYEKLEQI